MRRLLRTILPILACLPFALHAEDEAAQPRSTRDDVSLELFLSDPAIATPIALDVDSRGRVWVIESNTHFQPPEYGRHKTDRILVLADKDGDGRAEHVGVFTDGLEQTMALSLDEKRSGDGTLLLATRRDVRLLRDSDGDGSADRTTFLARLETQGDYPHNGLSGFAFDGLGHVYFAMGENLSAAYRLSGSDGRSVVGGPDGGSIFRMRLDGTGLERWAIGFWNTFHLACDPYGRLFAVDNDPDSRPPCRLLHILRGGDYGYRRWLGRKGLHPFTAWNGELPGTLPMAASGTGEAPSGILWYARSGLPSDVRGKFLVTSWGDHRVSVYALERSGASFTSHPEPLVVGGEDFRPVGIAAAPDGTVYFSDWVKKDYPVHGHGRIWRLRSHGDSATPTTVLPAAVARYRSLVSRTRAGALGDALAPALADPLLEIRAAAVRLAFETGEISSDTLLEIIHAREEPEVILEALVALAQRAPRVGTDSSRQLEKLAIATDPFLSAAALRALARTNDSESLEARARELVEARVLGEGARRLALLLALRAAGDVHSRHFLPMFLADPDPAVRRAALQWIGEDRLFEHRDELDTSLVAGAPTREVLDAYLATRSLLAGESPEERDRVFRDDALRTMAEDRALPPELRALAVRSIARRDVRLDLALLKGLLSPRTDGASPLRRDAVRAIVDAAVPGGATILAEEAKKETNSSRLRREATAGLATFLPDEVVAGELEALAHGDVAILAEEARRALRLGGEEFPDELRTPDRATLIGDDPGDPAVGELLFFHPRGPRCGLCHTIAGRGGIVGPDLSRAGILDRDRLVDSVLTPSKEIAPQFVQWVVVTQKGVVAGTLSREEADGTLVLATAEGSLARIPPGEIIERSTSSVSVMPEGLLERLSPEEIQDLLAFLESLR